MTNLVHMDFVTFASNFQVRLRAYRLGTQKSLLSRNDVADSAVPC